MTVVGAAVLSGGLAAINGTEVIVTIPGFVSNLPGQVARPLHVVVRELSISDSDREVAVSAFDGPGGPPVIAAVTINGFAVGATSNQQPVRFRYVRHKRLDQRKWCEGHIRGQNSLQHAEVDTSSMEVNPAAIGVFGFAPKDTALLPRLTLRIRCLTGGFSGSDPQIEVRAFDARKFTTVDGSVFVNGTNVGQTQVPIQLHGCTPHPGVGTCQGRVEAPGYPPEPFWAP